MGKGNPWVVFDPQGEGTSKVTRVGDIKKSSGNTLHLDSSSEVCPFRGRQRICHASKTLMWTVFSFSIVICSLISASWYHAFKKTKKNLMIRLDSHLICYLDYPYIIFFLTCIALVIHHLIIFSVVFFRNCLFCPPLSLVYCMWMRVCVRLLYHVYIYKQPKPESCSSGLKLGKLNTKDQICRILHWNIFPTLVSKFSQLRLLSNFKYP